MALYLPLNQRVCLAIADNAHPMKRPQNVRPDVRLAAMPAKGQAENGPFSAKNPLSLQAWPLFWIASAQEKLTKEAIDDFPIEGNQQAIVSTKTTFCDFSPIQNFGRARAPTRSC